VSAPRHAFESCIDCTHRQLRLFCNLSGDALQRLDQIGTHLSLPPRSIAFLEGQPSKAVFVVCEGQLKLSATSSEGRSMILRLACAGDLLGLSAALNATPHEVTAETLEPTVLKSIRRADFLDFLNNYGEIGKKTAQVLAKEYHEVFLDARRLALSGSAAGRLAQLLLDWASNAACGKPELRFTMALTHEELANMAGTSRETVTRLLNRFERDGLIARHGSSMIILKPDQLLQLAA
jgi:CRP/FNR family transcriptional regulator, cyclic AMP receptor protein